MDAAFGVAEFIFEMALAVGIFLAGLWAYDKLFGP